LDRRGVGGEAGLPPHFLEGGMTKHILNAKLDAIALKERKLSQEIAELRDEVAVARRDIGRIKDTKYEPEEWAGLSLAHLEDALALIEREVKAAGVPLTKEWELKETIRGFLQEVSC
jgi:hypothetical protein